MNPIRLNAITGIEPGHLQQSLFVRRSESFIASDWIGPTE